jgi:hypothetical protein
LLTQSQRYEPTVWINRSQKSLSSTLQLFRRSKKRKS